jgi:putative sugar O-methyltransferase
MDDLDALTREMTAELQTGPDVFLPSKFWESLNRRNEAQLSDHGFASFKRTVNQNYFSWIVSHPKDPQFRAVLRDWLRHPAPSVAWSRLVDVRGVETGETRKQPFAKLRSRMGQAAFVAMLWEYVRHRDRLGLLDRLAEPELGAPILVRHRGRLISQDLANSAMEFYSIDEAAPLRPEATVIELGGGYGRLGWLMLSVVPGLRYVAVDIPPALALAQEYLTTVFPGVPAYRFRRGRPDPDEIRRARMAFLTPNQFDSLPPMGADAFVNISSLHEMRLDQISRYLELVDRHTRGVFYLKQWRAWTNPDDGVSIGESDYPIPSNWKKLYARQHPVQTHFFEAAYEVGERDRGRDANQENAKASAEVP